MAKGTSKAPSWLSNLWKGVLTAITLPVQLVVRLVERIAVGKDGVKENDKKMEEKERAEERALQKKIGAEREESSIGEALKDTDLSMHGDNAITKVEVDVTKEFGASRMYSITCADGKGYTIFRSNEGLLRTEHCPADVERQLATLIESADVRLRGHQEEEPGDNDVDDRGKDDEEQGAPEEGEMSPKEDAPSVGEESSVDDNAPAPPSEEIANKEEKEAEAGEIESKPVAVEPIIDKSFRFDNLSADISVSVTPLPSGAQTAVCVCNTRAGEFKVFAERDEIGLIVINSAGDKIKPDLASAMKKAVMSTYSEIPCKMDAGFIDKAHDILSEAMRNGSTQLIGVAYGHTLFTPDISGKCARVSSDLTLGKGNKPKDVSLGARQSADEIKRDIVSAYTKVESTVVGGGLPDSHYTTQDAVYLVRHHNDKPDIISYDGDRNQGEIKSDRMLSAREIQSINDYLIRTRLVGAEIADKEAEEFFAERLDPCGDSSLVCCAGGLYAYTEQVGMSSVLHVGAIDGSLPDVYKEISEGDDVKALVGELIDETHQVGSELEDLDGLDDHGEYGEF